MRALWPNIGEDKRKKAIIYEWDKNYVVDDAYANTGVEEGWLKLVGWHRMNGELIGRYVLIDLLDFLDDFDFDF